MICQVCHKERDCLEIEYENITCVCYICAHICTLQLKVIDADDQFTYEDTPNYNGEY